MMHAYYSVDAFLLSTLPLSMSCQPMHLPTYLSIDLLTKIDEGNLPEKEVSEGVTASIYMPTLCIMTYTIIAVDDDYDDGDDMMLMMMVVVMMMMVMVRT